MNGQISFECRSCGAKLRALQSKAGQSLPCPKCRADVEVPSPQTSAIEVSSSIEGAEVGVDDDFFESIREEEKSPYPAAAAPALGPTTVKPTHWEKSTYENAIRYASVVSNFIWGCAYITIGVAVLFFMLVTAGTLFGPPDVPFVARIVVPIFALLNLVVVVAGIILVTYMALLTTSIVFLLADIHRRQCGIATKGR